MSRIAAIVVAFTCGLAGPVMASGADIQGATCVPDRSTMYGAVTTNGGISGSGNFYCNIPNASQMTSPTTFSISFDPGTGSERIIATYYKIGKTTGALTAVANIFTSSSCLKNLGGKCMASAPFSDAFDPSSYRYFIAVTLQSAGNPSSLVLWGASLY